MKSNFAEYNEVGIALVPQSINAAATANGAAIDWNSLNAEQLAFIVAGATNTGVTTLTIKVQTSDTSDFASADVLKEKDGTTDLQFTAAKTIAGAALAAGTLVGVLDLIRVKGLKKYVRLAVTAVAGAAATVSAVYVASPLKERPGKTTDDFLTKIIPLP